MLSQQENASKEKDIIQKFNRLFIKQELIIEYNGLIDRYIDAKKCGELLDALIKPINKLTNNHDNYIISDDTLGIYIYDVNILRFIQEIIPDKNLQKF